MFPGHLALYLISLYPKEFINEVVGLLNFFVPMFNSLTKHTLTKVDTTGSFDMVARTHKRRGFFLSDELKNRRVVGEFPGATKAWKMNTYGLTWDQIKYVTVAFHDIAKKYGLAVA